jgi:hypothetical protein
MRALTWVGVAMAICLGASAPCAAAPAGQQPAPSPPDLPGLNAAIRATEDPFILRCPQGVFWRWIGSTAVEQSNRLETPYTIIPITEADQLNGTTAKVSIVWQSGPFRDGIFQSPSWRWNAWQGGQQIANAQFERRNGAWLVASKRVILERRAGGGFALPMPDCAAIAGAPASAQPAQGGAGKRQVVLVDPVWIRRPTAEDLMTYFPDRALHAGVTGHVTLNCDATQEGLLTDCLVAKEDPPGMGFGAAAHRLAKLFKLAPLSQTGHPIQGNLVRLPLVFMPPASPPARN